MKQHLEVIGATDMVDLPELGWFNVPVRIDSGATSSAIHCSRVRLIKNGEQTMLCFYLDAKKGAPQQSLGRKLLKNRFIIDVSRKNLSADKQSLTRHNSRKKTS
jgi:hypothetical protein